MSRDPDTADRAVGHSDTPADRRFVVGRDVGTVAGWFRIIFGLIAVASLWYRVDKALDGGELAMMVVWFALVAAVYTVVLWLFGRIDRFRGVSPWIPSALLQLPMMLYPMGIGSDPMHQALAVYTTFGVLLCGMARYGGLEVAALPMLLLRRRTVLYSPFNAVDIVEQAFRRERTRGVVWATALALTVAVLIEYWWVGLLLSVPPVKDLIGESIRLPGLWALLLLVPAAWFAARAVRGRDGYRAVPLGERWPGLAAVVLLVLIPMLGNRQVPDSLWGVIMFVGLVVGLVALVRLPFGRSRGTGRRAPEVAASR